MTAARPVSLAIAALFLGAGCSEDAGAEQNHAALERFERPGFAIDLPGEPVATSQTVETEQGTLEAFTYIVETEDAAVAVSVIDLPYGFVANLDGAVQGAADKLDGAVAEVAEAEHDDHQARDYRITYERGGTEYTAFARSVLTQDVLVSVQQVVEGENVQDPPESFPRIVDSLELSDTGMS